MSTPPIVDELPLSIADDGPPEAPSHPVYPENGPSVSNREAGAFSAGPRARPRREIPVLPIAALVLMIGAATVYFFWDDLFGAAPPPQVSASATGQQEPVDASNLRPAPEQEESGQESPEQSPQARESAPPQRTPGSQQAKPAPPPPRKAPAQNRATSNAAARGALTKIVDIRWRVREGGKVSVILEGDGPISEKRLRRSRLGGDKPRVLLRLSGVKERYGQTNIAVGNDTLLGIRTGHHKGDELHVVLDLPSESVHVSNVRHQAKVVEIILDRR